MKSLKLLLLVTCLGFLGPIPSQAEKFSSSLHSDIGSSVGDQTNPIVPQLPGQATSTRITAEMPTAPPTQPLVPEATDIPAAVPGKPLISGPDPAPPEIPTVQGPSFSNQPNATIKNPFEVKAPRISAPDFEAKFKKLQQQQLEEKAKKKKKFSESIMDEFKNYGLFFLFGLAAILLVYVLRKEAPSKQLLPENAKEPLDLKKDIWKEDF